MFIKVKLYFKPVDLVRIKKNYLQIFSKNTEKYLALEIFMKLFIFLTYL